MSTKVNHELEAALQFRRQDVEEKLAEIEEMCSRGSIDKYYDWDVSELASDVRVTVEETRGVFREFVNELIVLITRQ